MTGSPIWRRLGGHGLLWLLLALLAVLLLWPVALTVIGGFLDADGNLTLAHLAALFEDPLVLEGLANSLLIAVCTTLLSLALSMPLALVAARYDFPGKAILGVLIMLPLILPPFVGAIGLRVLLGRFGAVNALLAAIGIGDPGRPATDLLHGGFWSVVVMEALHLYPILYLNLVAALANLDPTLEEAASSLGSGHWMRFRRITVPLILPGLFAGCTLVFIWSFTELGTPLMLDYYRVTPVQIFWGVMEIDQNPRPFALVVVMLAAAVALYLLGRVLVGGRIHAMHSKASVAAATRRLRGVGGAAAAGLFAVVVTACALPHLGLVISSLAEGGTWYRTVLPERWTLDHFAGALTHPMAMGSIRNSLLYAGAAMVLCVLMGLAIAYVVERVRVRGVALLDGLAMLPLAVPGLVMAFGYVAMTLHWPFGPGGPLEGLVAVVGSEPNPVPLLIIAYAVRRLPYVVRSAAAGLQQTPVELEEAALGLGATRLATMRHIVVPLILANLVAGAILAFSFSMLEVSDSLILAQKQVHYPVTKAIYELFSRLGDGPYLAGAMGVWGMMLLAVTLAAAMQLLGKKMGALFRL